MGVLFDVIIFDFIYMLFGFYFSQLMVDMGVNCIKIEFFVCGEVICKLFVDDENYLIEGVGVYFFIFS